MISQHRRDFVAIFICEHCNDEIEKSGYDDTHYHANVVPDLECKECGKKSPDDYTPRAPKYNDMAIL